MMTSVTETTKKKAERLCYLFLIFLTGCVLSALFRTPITYWESAK